MEEVADARHRLGGLPLLAQDSHQLALGYCRCCDMFYYIGRERLVEVAELALLAIVDSVGVILAYPLTPAMQHQPAALAYFLPGELGIANEEDMDREAHVCQCLG